MANKVTVYDCEGNKRVVRQVDATEILASGGSLEPPKAKEAPPVPTEVAAETATEAETAIQLCHFIKKDGQRCSNKAVADSDYCFVKAHQG